MSTTHFLALFLILGSTAVCTLLTTFSYRLRDIAFFAMVAGVIITTTYDVNFFSLQWYRGTTRGVEMTPVDILAMALFAACLLNPRYKDLPRIFVPAGLSFLLIYVTYCVFSAATATPKAFAFFEVSKIMRGILIFVATALYVRTRRELTLLVSALACAVCINGGMAIKQRYLEGMHRVEGMVDDPNSLSMFTCMIAPIFVAAAMADFPKWLKAFCWVSCCIAGLTVLLTISRAGVPIFAMVMFGAALFTVSWKITFKKVAVCILIAFLSVGAVYKAWDMLMTRYGQATLEEEYMNKHNEGRGVYFRWAEAILNDHFYGVGLNNWSYWVSAVYGPKAGFPYKNYDDTSIPEHEFANQSAIFAAPAHNLMALTAGELGVPGVIIFGLVWIRWFSMGVVFLFRRSTDPMVRLGIGLFFCTAGVFLQSITEWTFRQTPIFLAFHILAGTLASLHFHRKWEARRLRDQADEDEVREGTVFVEVESSTPAMARQHG